MSRSIPSWILATVCLGCLCSFGWEQVEAQESAYQLVITEVFLVPDAPRTSWVEVYNASDRALSLVKFRLSGVRTTNVLPKEVQDQGGIEVSPGGCLVLCASRSLFTGAFGEDVVCADVDALSHLGDGGFLAVTTNGAEESRAGIVRYGDPRRSPKVERVAGSQEMPFLTGTQSYRRKVEALGAQILLSDFVAGPPTPGVPER